MSEAGKYLFRAMCFGVVAIFVVECYGCVYCGWWCSVGYTVYGLPKNVRVVPVISVCILVFLP